MRRPLVLLVVTLILSSCRSSAPPAPASIPIFDGHVDTLIHFVGEDSRRWTDPASYDITTRTQGQVDLPRMIEGGIAGGLFTVAVLDPARFDESLGESIGILRSIERQSGGSFVLVRDRAALQRAFESRRIAAVPALEGGDQIGESLDNLRLAHGRGVRSMALTWEKTNAIGDSNADAPRHDGLSPFGRQVVAEMNTLGMIIDLSHAAESTTLDVLELTSAPVILSHSSAAALCGTPRNASDALLARMAQNRGLIMVTFVPYMTDCEYRDWYLEGEKVWSALESQHGSDSPAARSLMADWEHRNPPPVVTLDQVADHIEHVRKVAGIDHVGIGSDFDGMYSHVEGLEDISRMQALLAELSRRGWSTEELEQLAWRNFVRVWSDVESAARPSEYPGN